MLLKTELLTHYLRGLQAYLAPVVDEILRF